LRFLGHFDNSFEAFEHFFQKRAPHKQSLAMTNSEKRYLQYFDSLFSFQGVLPNQRQVYLHKL